MFNLRITVLLIVSFSNVFAENVANISDSLAVETTVDTIKISTSLAPVTKSKPEKRDSSDQIGPTIFALKEDEPFRPITGATYRQQLQLHPQQFESSPAPSTFQPTTVRHVAEEAAPQGYYERHPNADGSVISSGSKITSFVDGGIHYGTPHASRGPFKGPYQLQLEHTHPQPYNHPQTQQQPPFQLKQRYHQQQYVSSSKLPPSINYAYSSPDVGFTPLQEQSPHHHRPYYTQTQDEQQQIDQQKQQQQQQQQHQQQQQQNVHQLQKHLQPQPPYVASQNQGEPQLQQLQYQQPSRQQIQYIIAIPLSYVRQLQHQLAAQNGSPPATQQQQQQQLHQALAPQALQSPRASLPPLIVLQPIGSNRGGGNSLSREPFRQQPLVHYAPQAPAPSNPEAGPHVQSPPVLAPQQLTIPLNLILAAAAGRPRQPVYPAPQLLYVQPQLIRQAPPQQLQLQVNHQQLYAQAPNQQQQQHHTVEERNAQHPQQQVQPQQHEPRTKPTVNQAQPPSPSVATASSSPSLPPSIPPQATPSRPPAALPLRPPVFFYNPTYVQAPPPEQHPLPPSHYGNYIQGQFAPAQQTATLVKLSSPNALLAPQTAAAPAPPYYHVHHPFNGLPPLAAVLNPQSLLFAKTPLQHPHTPHQQPSALPAFVSRPAVYMAPQEAVGGIGAPGLPYFIHPAGVHYGTHLYNPATPLVASAKLLESVANADGDNQQRHQHQQLQPEHHRKEQQQEQQQLGSRAASGGKDENNAIVKYP